MCTGYARGTKRSELQLQKCFVIAKMFCHCKNIMSLQIFFVFAIIFCLCNNILSLLSICFFEIPPSKLADGHQLADHFSSFTTHLIFFFFKQQGLVYLLVFSHLSMTLLQVFHQYTVKMCPQYGMSTILNHAGLL